MLPDHRLNLSQETLHRLRRQAIPSRQDMGVVLSVVEVSACPSMAETAVIGMPSASSSEAAAWRMS